MEKITCIYAKNSIIYAMLYRGCSSAGLERLPVTQKVAGSSPVNPASNFTSQSRRFLFFMRNNILLINLPELLYLTQP